MPPGRDALTTLTNRSTHSVWCESALSSGSLGPSCSEDSGRFLSPMPTGPHAKIIPANGSPNPVRYESVLSPGSLEPSCFEQSGRFPSPWGGGVWRARVRYMGRSGRFVTFGVYRFWRAYIDGYSALGVVYEVSLEVVMTTHAWCAGDAGIAIWRARLFGAHFTVGVWSRQTYKLYWDEISCIVKLNWVYISVLHNGKPIGYRS